MIPRIVCFFMGHKYWEWIVTDYKPSGLCEGGWKKEIRAEYQNCLRCDKRRVDRTGAKP